MKPAFKILFSFLFLVFSFSFQRHEDKGKIVYKTDNLMVIKLSDHVYQHISFLNTESFGKVSCNGMIVNDRNEAVIFDTPTDDKSSRELISWIKNSLHSRINAIVATHFHEDCLGGLKEFHNNNIPSYASNKTIELAKDKGFNVPDHGFDGILTLKAGEKPVSVEFFGEGHTRDNVIAYFPDEKVMFGGCLIKETGASKGYLGDANVKEWPATVEKIKARYPDVKVIIPGHGKTGNRKLLDYTIELFKNS
ncbi:subclass B1 metallo-beta-lactamase [Chryseobacterium gossypii]|uniref:subclass B1 metallo-beta-lactamase n=1 Tax=Chryseobacterium gossypii TaxID=3231602 RepID=UPI0035259D2F